MTQKNDHSDVVPIPVRTRLRWALRVLLGLPVKEVIYVRGWERECAARYDHCDLTHLEGHPRHKPGEQYSFYNRTSVSLVLEVDREPDERILCPSCAARVHGKTGDAISILGLGKWTNPAPSGYTG